jgi:hypothetical protein
MKPPRPSPLILLLPCALDAGCRSLSRHSPTVDVLGSYFPAWLLCGLIGLALTLILRLIFVAAGVNPYLRPAPLVYPSLLAVFTLVTWLLFFRN